MVLGAYRKRNAYWIVSLFDIKMICFHEVSMSREFKNE